MFSEKFNINLKGFLEDLSKMVSAYHLSKDGREGFWFFRRSSSKGASKSRFFPFPLAQNEKVF
jgi:hypothetical protein